MKNSRNIAILQHSDGTPPGSVSEWLTARHLNQDLRRLHRGEALPTIDELQAVIILGGPMNVDDVDDHPWLAREKEFLRLAVERGLPCIGLCLGGQLLAQTLGARVQKNSHWEVGWHEVAIEPSDLTSARRLTVFQWHQDMFGLPAGAEKLASNDITPFQAFTFKDHVLGVQFHPEATAEWVRECTEEKEYPTGPFVQKPETVMAGVKHLPEMRSWFFKTLDAFAEKAFR